MIHIRSEREIELIRESCKIVSQAFTAAKKFIEPGVETRQLDTEIEQFIVSRGARPAFKGYNGFPASSCISIDNEVVHGIPGERVLQAGQIVSVDIGVEFEGFFGDSAETFAVGTVSEEKRKLMDVTKRALDEGLKRAQAGARLSDISHAIQTTVEEEGFSVVRELVGHGIGRQLHEDPQIPNYGPPNSGPRLKPGMVLAIEPMVNLGGHQVRTLDDNWTVVTEDDSPSAHFEHTIVITTNGPEILTLRN